MEHKSSRLLTRIPKTQTFTFLRQVSVKPSTKTIFLVPGAFTMTDHDNFVHHFREIMDDSSFNVDSGSWLPVLTDVICERPTWDREQGHLDVDSSNAVQMALRNKTKVTQTWKKKCQIHSACLFSWSFKSNKYVLRH